MQIQGHCTLFVITPFLPFHCYDTMKHPTTLLYRLIHLQKEVLASGGQKQRVDILEGQSNPQGIDLCFWANNVLQ